MAETMNTEPKTEADQLWSRLWMEFFEINDSDWPTQSLRLREIARIAGELAALIEGRRQ